MSPAWGGTPAVLRLLGGLTLLLPPLLLCPHAARGDCTHPPDIPNAQPDLKGLTSFPNGSVVTYKCNKDFVKVPGKLDSVICLENDEWSEIKEFCNRSCNVPTRLLFATLKKPYNTQNYFPVGSVVEYECRLGFKRNHSLSGKLTCLQNFTWSKSDEFCQKKSCPNPGEIINGNVIKNTDILYGSSISFSCNTGYILVGTSSSVCVLKGNGIDWSHPLPECKESSPISKVTSTPQKPTTTDAPGTKPPSTPQKFTTVKVPAIESPPTPQKTTTVNVSATEATSTLQKPMTANVSATEATSTPQKLITANESATIAKIFPVLNSLSTETPLTAQTPIMANSSATQITPKTQRFTTAKASPTQSPPVTQKFTAVHTPVTKGLHTTQRLISAHIIATQSQAVTKASVSVHSSSTSKGSGTLSTGTSIIASGHTFITLTVLLMTLVAIGYLT